MYQYHCLNPISNIGLSRFTENYQKTEEIKNADGVLVRSAAMHDIELPEILGGKGRKREKQAVQPFGYSVRNEKSNGGAAERSLSAQLV